MGVWRDFWKAFEAQAHQARLAELAVKARGWRLVYPTSGFRAVRTLLGERRSAVGGDTDKLLTAIDAVEAAVGVEKVRRAEDARHSAQVRRAAKLRAIWLDVPTCAQRGCGGPVGLVSSHPRGAEMTPGHQLVCNACGFSVEGERADVERCERADAAWTKHERAERRRERAAAR